MTANKQRQDLTNTLVRDSSFSIVLIFVVITFLLCNVLALIINLMECMWKVSLIEIEHVSNFLITLNSSVNCAIYCVFGNKFREQLFLMKDELVEKGNKFWTNIGTRTEVVMQLRYYFLENIH